MESDRRCGESASVRLHLAATTLVLPLVATWDELPLTFVGIVNALVGGAIAFTLYGRQYCPRGYRQAARA